MSNTIRLKKKVNHKRKVSVDFTGQELTDLEGMTDKHYFGNMSLAVRESVKYARVHRFNKKGIE